jgi:hypothetical protein
MSNHPGQQIVILTTIWWWQKLGRDWQCVNKQRTNKVEGKEQYHIEISNRFAALENLDAEVDVNKAWETIGENIKISAKESLGYYEPEKYTP